MSGTIVRTARIALGMTQDEAARRSGMTRSHLSLVEAGQSSLSPEKACRLAATLCITLEDVYAQEAAKS